MTRVGQEAGKLVSFLACRVSLIGYAARFTGDRQIAEDLVQDAWLRFDAAPSGMSPRESIAYLHTVVRNLARDWKRRRTIRRAVFEDGAGRDVVSVASFDPSQETRLIAADDLRLLREALAAMPPRMRRAVEMHRIEGRTLKAIGETLGLSVSTVHGLVTEGLARCRAHLLDAGR